MKVFLFAVFGQSLAQWVARDSSPHNRGPQGASAVSDMYYGPHMYKPSGSYRWDWLSSMMMSYDPSHSAIYNYRQYGLDGLTGKLLSLMSLIDSNYFFQIMRPPIRPTITNCMPGCIESPMPRSLV